MIRDLCEFIREITNNPDGIVHGLTVRDYRNLQDHLIECDDCYERCSKVVDEHPDTPQKNDLFGEN